MAGKGGGAWKVAYADFVTAMMAFFMVMWLTSQKPEVKQAVAGYFRDPYAIFKGNETGSAADAAPTEDPKLGHDRNSQRRHVPNSGNDANYQFAVLFTGDDADLDAAAREKIRSFAPTMVGKLNRVEIRGHCQRKPLPKESPFKDGWDLCYARSRAVQQELQGQGIDPDRIRLSVSEANEPLAINLTDEELALNSRVDIILLDDLIETPWRQPGVDGASEGGETAAPHAADAPPLDAEAEANKGIDADGKEGAAAKDEPTAEGVAPAPAAEPQAEGAKEEATPPADSEPAAAPVDEPADEAEHMPAKT